MHILLSILLTAVVLPAQTLTFQGICDASAALWLNGKLLVINDEDQSPTTLRFYDPQAPGAPASTIDLPTANLAIDPQNPEIDLEAATTSTDTTYLLGSHSRNKNGKPRLSRQRLIAFEWKNGKPHNVRALPNLMPAFSHLDQPADPKDGGLSLEGLAASPNGDLYLGLRYPLSSTKNAILARLTPGSSQPAFIELPLAQTGVRDLLWDAPRSRFLILSGPVGPGGPFFIWSWTPGSSAPRKLADVSSIVPAHTSAEGLIPTADAKAFYLIFDEGSRPNSAGKECKDLPPSQQSFRITRITLPN